MTKEQVIKYINVCTVFPYMEAIVQIQDMGLNRTVYGTLKDTTTQDTIIVDDKEIYVDCIKSIKLIAVPL